VTYLKPTHCKLVFGASIAKSMNSI